MFSTSVVLQMIESLRAARSTHGGGDGRDRSEQILDCRFFYAARDEHQSSRAIVTRPRCELDRWMKQMLHALYDERTFATFNVHESLHAQQIGAAQRSEHFQALRERSPRKRLLVP